VCCSVLQCVEVCTSMLQCVVRSLQRPFSNNISGGQGGVCLTRQGVLCVAVCCSVLQGVAVCCSALQCVAVCCSVLPCVAVCCSVLQKVYNGCYRVISVEGKEGSVLLDKVVALCCSMLQCVAVYCNLLRYVAVCCSML